MGRDSRPQYWPFFWAKCSVDEPDVSGKNWSRVSAAKWLQHGDFPIIELLKGNALRIAGELLSFVKVGHKQIR